MNFLKYILCLVALLVVAPSADAQRDFHADSTEQGSIAAIALNNGSVFFNRPGNRPGLEWPRGSGHFFALGAGLWVGARVDLAEKSDSIVFMTFNPNSGESWANPLTFVNHSFRSNGERLWWSFNDSAVGRYEGGEERRRDEGYPLGLHFVQEMMSWSSGPYENSLVITTKATNTSTSVPLQDFALGWAMDIDIGVLDSGRSLSYHDKLGLIRQEPTPIMRAYDTIDRHFGSMGIAFIESPGLSGLRSCSPWSRLNALERFDRYDDLTRGFLDTNFAVAGRDIAPILSAAPITLQPGESITIVMLLVFDEDVSDAADKRIAALVDSFIVNSMDADTSPMDLLSVYPNPTAGSNHITVKNAAVGSTLTVIDLLGRERLVATSASQPVNISSLEPGLYGMKIISTRGVEFESLLVTQ